MCRGESAFTAQQRIQNHGFRIAFFVPTLRSGLMEGMPEVSLVVPDCRRILVLGPPRRKSRAVASLVPRNAKKGNIDRTLVSWGITLLSFTGSSRRVWGSMEHFEVIPIHNMHEGKRILLARITALPMRIGHSSPKVHMSMLQRNAVRHPS
jgi:hypothetical protein